MESVFGWIGHYGYAALFLALMLGIAGLPIPDETLLVFSGYLISKGRLQPVATGVVAFAGSCAGISLSYVLGRTIGHEFVARFGRYLGITEERLAHVRRWFEHTGEWLLTFGYYILGVRHFTALVAGMSGLEYRRFAVFAYAGAALWVSTFLTLGFVVGERWRELSDAARRYSFAFLLVAALLAAAVWLIRRVRSRAAKS